MTLEGSQSQQLPGGINFSRLSPVELLGNLLGDKNSYICRGQIENRGLQRPGQAGEGLGFQGKLRPGGCPHGEEGGPGSPRSAPPWARGKRQASREASAQWLGLSSACQAALAARSRAQISFLLPCTPPATGACPDWGTRG